MTTGEKITKCRKEQGLTQTQLAETLGVTRQAVSRWESDLAFPETDTLIKMSKLFNVSCDWLLKYDGVNAAREQESEAENGRVGEEEEQEEGRERAQARSGKRIVIDFSRLYIEYKSRTKVGNLPLVHINIGFGRTAKGVVAVGLAAVGVVSVGVFSLGVLSFGVLCLGLIGLGSFAVGILSAGAIALGGIALGGVAIGLFSMGGCAVGLFACGGYASGYFVAIGDMATGGIALGKTSASGRIISVLQPQFEAMKPVIYEKMNEIPEIWSVFAAWSKGLLNGLTDVAVNARI